MSKSLVCKIVMLVAVVVVGMPVTALADIKDGLISAWSFDEGSGTTALDPVGGNNGTIIGGAAYTAGKFGTALSFDGVGYYDDGNPETDYVDCGSDDSLKPASGVTVSAWIKTDYYVYYGQIAGYMTDTGASESGYAILTEDVGYLGAWITGDSGDGWYLWTTDIPPYPNTNWVHVALTYDGAESILYVNAKRKAVGTHSGDIDYEHVGNFLIGLYDDPIGNYWWPYAGLIDDVGVWGRALTPAEIDFIYNDGIGQPIPVPLVVSTPANGATLVPLDQVLSWELIREIDLVGYDVWFGTDANEISPNYDFTKVLSLTTDTSYAPTGLEFNNTYYWRVDVHEANDVGTIFHEGWLKEFTTAPPEPVITSDPASQAVPTGDSAQLTVGGVNMEVFEWYKQGDPDELLVSDGIKIIGAETATLTITDFQLADEGMYYCIVTNDEGSDTSQAATLMVARLIGYWPLDGDFLDASGLGNDGTPIGDPTYVTGLIGSNAVNLDGNDYIVIDGVVDNIPSNDITLSGWVKTGDQWGDWLSCNTADYGNVAMLEIWDGYVNMFEGVSEAWSTTYVSDGQWHLLTYTRIGDTGSVYVDGALEATHIANFNFNADDRWSIGQEWDWDAETETGVPSDFLTGDVDDVRIYNYGLDVYEVADLYLSVKTDEYVCINPSELTMDFDGNCKVDIDDFVNVAGVWLECNIVPTCLP